MSSYIGQHARFYDLFYSGKEYKKEVDFIDHLIKTFHKGNPKNILEIACGTGSHAFLMEKFGYEIYATDYSEYMIEQAKIKREERNSNIRFDVWDMLEVSKIEQSFDVVLCLFDSIGYVLTNENIKTVLKGVFEKLNTGGIFILEFWHGAAMMKNYEPVRIRRWKLENSEVLRISETGVNYANQTCEVSYSIYETKSDGTYTYIHEKQKNRFFLLQEMKLFLESCNFKVCGNYTGYFQNENIDDSTWHIVTVAQRCGDKNIEY